MTPHTKNGCTATVVDPQTRIASAQDMLDVFATARYETDCDAVIVYAETLGDAFFDLKTRVAGEILQKCSNYQIRLAIVGDFSAVTSKSLRDFIYECNNGRLVFFKNSVDEAFDALTAKR